MCSKQPPWGKNRLFSSVVLVNEVQMNEFLSLLYVVTIKHFLGFWTCNLSYLTNFILICISYYFCNTFLALSYCLQTASKVGVFLIKSIFYLMLTPVSLSKHKTILPNVIMIELRYNLILLRSHRSELCKRIRRSVFIIHFSNFIVCYHLTW